MTLARAFAILAVVESVHAAIDTGVTVFGTTVAPNFKRLEGRPSASCPSSHPYACDSGLKCTSDMFKPNNAQPDCDGGLVDIFSTCFTTNVVDCSPLQGQHCTSNPIGALCPLDYPHAYNGGKDCCSSPWRDLIPGDSTCDGGILQVADSCCPAGKSISCNTDSTYTCQTNPKYGYVCPSTHRYPCQNGHKCSKTMWKPTSGNESDCDGTRLTKGSMCCHPDGDMVDCNGDSSRFQCKENPRTKGMATIGEYKDDDDWFFMDLRKQCLSSEGHIMSFPEVLAHKAVGMTNGRVVACGGEGTGNTDRCYDYTPSDGWTQIGSYPKIMKWMTSIVIDEGTSAEKLYMGGGYNSALGSTSLERYPKLLAVYDANAKTWREDSEIGPLPHGGMSLLWHQMDHDRILMGGGRYDYQPQRNFYIFTRSAIPCTIENDTGNGASIVSPPCVPVSDAHACQAHCKLHNAPFFTWLKDTHSDPTKRKLCCCKSDDANTYSIAHATSGVAHGCGGNWNLEFTITTAFCDDHLYTMTVADNTAYMPCHGKSQMVTVDLTNFQINVLFTPDTQWFHPGMFTVDKDIYTIYSSYTGSPNKMRAFIRDGETGDWTRMDGWIEAGTGSSSHTYNPIMSSNAKWTYQKTWIPDSWFSC